MKTMYDKIWDRHVIAGEEGELQLLYVDMHYIHEVTSPQAFEGLELAGRRVRRPDKTFATMDHNTPTVAADRGSVEAVADPLAREQLATLAQNCRRAGIRLADMNHEDNGIVHIIGPELGLSLPGSLMVCGDSHTATHGAFGAIAFGIGTSEVEHVLATQTIWQKKLKNLGVKVSGSLPPGVYAKDVILYLLGRYGVSVGSGYAMEFFGETIRAMSMDERMTLCNMAIEGGAKVGMVAADEVTFHYLENRKYGPDAQQLERIRQRCRELQTDAEAAFDRVIELDVSQLEPQISWGTNPGMTVGISAAFPPVLNDDMAAAYRYMGLEPGQQAGDIPVSEVFIGSCTNGRYSDLAVAASYLAGKRVAAHIRAVVVPGSMAVKRQAEENGLRAIFEAAGCQWREPGCSSCLGMNPDLIGDGKHCISTSNRNFEGRQGAGARTHLVSPAVAAATAVTGRVVHPKEVGHEGI
ncbi:MAG: 3-isopropylmalate dehydratase large subunit [Eubacteriales bacterium]|nr:3-isopropylmalate dehydratase large subunit [Eubacteriales bacterium]